MPPKKAATAAPLDDVLGRKGKNGHAEKKKLYSTLIQTLVPLEVGKRLKELAREEGMSLAAYVRRLILIDWRKKTKRDNRNDPMTPVA